MDANRIYNENAERNANENGMDVVYNRCKWNSINDYFLINYTDFFIADRTALDQLSHFVGPVKRQFHFVLILTRYLVAAS